MMVYRICRSQALLLGIVLMLSTVFSTSHAYTSAKTPAATINRLYEVHLHGKGKVFDPKSRSILDQFFDQKLANLIWKSMHQDTFDVDPLTNAQDLENPNFKVGESKVKQDNATVKLTFSNFGKSETYKFDLHRIGSAWKVSDIHYANGSDLLNWFK